MKKFLLCCAFCICAVIMPGAGFGWNLGDSCESSEDVIYMVQKVDSYYEIFNCMDTLKDAFTYSTEQTCKVYGCSKDQVNDLKRVFSKAFCNIKSSGEGEDKGLEQECSVGWTIGYYFNPDNIRKSRKCPSPEDVCVIFDTDIESDPAWKCREARKTDPRANWNGIGCNCGDTAIWDEESGRCIDISPGVEKCYERCTDLTGNNKAECRACCEVNKNIATWEADPNNPGYNYCKCVQTDYKFDVEQRVCLPAMPIILESNDKCSAELLAKLDEWAEKYSDNTEIMTLIAKIRELCNADSIDSSQVNTLYTNLAVLIAGLETNKTINIYATTNTNVSTSIEQLQLQQKIDSAIATMDRIQSGMKVTVWRDEEGKFNTSRLLSDSIAGVVLGTAGGLITSSVVKKNQVEDGFEDLQCTVGGQAVAGWGDEFRVGIQ